MHCSTTSADIKFSTTRMLLSLNHLEATKQSQDLVRDSFLPTHMHDWSLLRILLSLTQHLVRNRRSIAFSKRDVLQQIRNRIPFTPSKVNVRQFSGLISRNSRNAAMAFGTAGDSVRKTLKPIDSFASDSQHTRELRSISRRNFEEKNRLPWRNMIVGPFLFLLQFVFQRVATVAFDW